ncbi:MAG TPA: T9SS type A sorting domain-containing protein, partial [Ferruginibacter sp.]|nr:T9SS type A sorting domain-containing protein [Ferruginibacter sp.]
TAGQGSSSITVTFGSSSGNVSVAVLNACGTGARTNKAVSFALTRPATAKTSVVTVNNTLKNSFSIYPNPAYNTAAIVFDSERAGEKYSISISNSTGYTVYTSANVTAAGQNRLQLDLSKFKNGIYLVRLIAVNEIQTIRLVKGQ